MMTVWSLAYWTLWAGFVLSAALNLLHVRAGFLTNYLADVTVPALLYVMVRELVPGKGLRPRWIARAVGRTPLDLGAYGSGLAVCWGIDRIHTAEGDS